MSLFRMLLRRPGYTIINGVGLAVGMTCCLLIVLFVRHETSYDTFHPDAEHLYRVVQSGPSGTTSYSGPALATAIRDDIPGVENVMRVINFYDALIVRDPSSGEQNVLPAKVIAADPAFFETFGFDLIKGNPASVLAGPLTIVLTEETARRFFGAADPIGQTLSIHDVDMTVTGIMKDLPEQSHMEFDAVASFYSYMSLEFSTPDYVMTSFSWPSIWTYVTLAPNVDVRGLNTSMPAFIAGLRPPEEARQEVPVFEPVTDIHLHSSASNGMKPGGDAGYVWMAGALAVFILALACINFINLATAQSARRAREIGVRKTLGAERRQLVGMFLGRSCAISFFSMVLALLSVKLLLPLFGGLTGREIEFHVWADPMILFAALGIVLVTGLLAGQYPAFVLSSWKPVDVFKAHAPRMKGSVRLREGLVVFQFAVSIALIIATMIAWNQLQFIEQYPLGFDRDQITVVEAAMGRRDFVPFRDAILADPAVQGLTLAGSVPGVDAFGHYRTEYPGMPEGSDLRFAFTNVYYGFADLMSVPLLAGRDFSPDFTSDTGVSFKEEIHQYSQVGGRGFLINAAAARAMGMTPDKVVGQQLRLFETDGDIVYDDKRGTVVGVLADFHNGSLHNPVEPMVFGLATETGLLPQSANMLVKTRAGSADEVRSYIEAAWNRIMPGRLFKSFLLDTSIDQAYSSDRRLGKMIGGFTLMAIFIACLGLFGLASFSTAQRRREIGIRKVFGASQTRVVGLISGRFLRLVLLAAVLAPYPAWLIVRPWLEGYAYRYNPGASVFVVGGAIAIMVALLTVAGQAMRAARVSPVESLGE